MIPIRLSRDAANYVRREAEYLRDRNPTAAKSFSLAIKKARRMLQDFPQSGNQMHGLQIAGNRTLVAGDYLLDYSYDGVQIEISTIRHGRMAIAVPDLDLDKDLQDPDDENSQAP
jgi:plasmid stabilization system protein ParE